MPKIALAFVLALVSTNLFAASYRSIDEGELQISERIARSRHYTFRPETALTTPEKQDLAARGVKITQPAVEGGYVVRVAPGVAIDDRFEAVTVDRKIHRRALREATSNRTMARVNVLFHEDVPFEAAINLVVEAGAALRDPFQLGYLPTARIAISIAPARLRALAEDERVVMIEGPVSLRQTVHNASSAQLSNVDDLHVAPYSLDGSGVTISFFELAPALASHVEFGGRLTTNNVSGSTSGSNADHATHVAGTLGASGVQSSAKGMAPAVTLHEYDANDDGDFGILLNRKKRLPEVSSVADSNSWGYVLGWCGAPSCADGWVWDETSEYYGGYDAFFSAPLDRVARDTDVLMVHSAGNDAEKTGPTVAPFAHKHDEDKKNTYCYSANGSGTDCPATPCTSGPRYCETKRHPEITSQLPAPWISVGIIASAKNVLTVGAVNSGKFIASFSSRGPTRDGRVKPEIVARGVSVYSTLSDGAYGNKSGTSMSTPAVTGSAALLTQQWKKSNNGANPSARVLKTLLIASTEDLGNPGPDFTYGFGLLDAKAGADLIIADAGTGRRVKTAALAQGGTFEVPVTIATPQTLRVVLSWYDPEVLIFADDDFATSSLVNDLDLKVVNASGQESFPYVLDRLTPDGVATRGVNNIDNTEMLEIRNAAPGTYRILVSGSRITSGPVQEFALVANAGLAPNAAPCLDLKEPNGTEATASGLVIAEQSGGRICGAGDIDLFRFTATKSGPITVSVTASGTPLRVTLTNNAASTATATVAAGATETLTLQHVDGQAATYFVRVEPLAEIGADSSYVVTAEYPVDNSRRRATRR